MFDYTLTVNPKLSKLLSKLYMKNRKQYDIIMKKAAEVCENPHHYKNLKSPKNHLKRVHIDSHFVLVFEVDNNFRRVHLEDYDHHDNIYK
jgi:YafQ family addiction module toxin component